MSRSIRPEYLKQKYEKGQITLKSIRLALQPAIDLIIFHTITTLPLQHQVNSYLATKTGQTAAITGFITHLKQQYNCDLEINRRIIQRIKETRFKKSCTQRLVELYRQDNLTEQDQVELVGIALYCLHNVLIKTPERDQIHKINGNYFYNENQNKHFLPKDIILRLT
ncbi:hypothetical protein HC723_16610 [Vibrio sp. S11_S32]|uniref:hypothetical protein n=1 Tax=Vibrio sp. S11_S32 TaxID=2720225 RepID=UPI0016801EE0|nr:hypothetical protein [Vibrio sp. S11_S32]MBD1578010.1 hypothetical protein [Vibrio sp. S11_S32]